MACENKYITLLDLARQAKIITGNTACFDGKIETGIPTYTTSSIWFLNIGEESDFISHGMPYNIRVDDLDMYSWDNEKAVLHLTSPTEEKRLTLAVGESTKTFF